MIQMQKDITYREIRKGEEEEICRLVMDCFAEFVAPGYSEEGVTEFSKYVNPIFTRQRMANKHFIILALDNNSAAGVIEVRNYNHICLFFVKKEYKNRGVGRELINWQLRNARLPNLTLRRLKSILHPTQFRFTKSSVL